MRPCCRSVHPDDACLLRVAEFPPCPVLVEEGVALRFRGCLHVFTFAVWRQRPSDETAEHTTGHVPTIRVHVVDVPGRKVFDASRSLSQPPGLPATMRRFAASRWTVPIALTAGNCVILKPSEKVPLTMRRVGQLLQEAG